MKELTIEQKAKAYDEALERAKKLQKTCDSMALVGWCEYIFPELKEREDERIRNFLIDFIKICAWTEKKDQDWPLREDCIAWLEKQGEQTHAELGQSEMTKTSDKELEPKFHPGDWVIDNFGNTYQIETATEIESEHIFGYTIVGGGYFNDNSNVRLWSINDAKDGDVLVDAYGNIGIFEKCYDFDWVSCCSLGNNGGFQYFTVEHENEKTYPATKEQRDLFFRKMKEAGWEWYGDKKELCYKYISNYEI